MAGNNGKKNLAKKNELFKKSNFLIGSKYKSTITENKLMAVALSKIQNAPEDEQGNLVCRMEAGELRRIFDDKKGSLYKQLDDTSKRMISSVIGASNAETKRFKYISLFSSAEYSEGIFTIKFNGELKNQLINISEKYTLLNLQTMIKFKSVYSFRLYEILKSDEYISKRPTQGLLFNGYEMPFGLSELKLDLGVVNASEDKVKQLLSGAKYPDYDKAVEIAEDKVFNDWRDFKRNVLDKAVKEISEKTELTVSYNTNKAGKGGKVNGVTFMIIPKGVFVENTKKRDLTEEEKYRCIDDVIELIDEKITVTDARNILRTADYCVDIIKEKYLIAKKQGKISNITGWMIDAIKNDYNSGISKQSKLNSFNSFEQNKYDFEELEKQILDN